MPNMPSRRARRAGQRKDGHQKPCVGSHALLAESAPPRTAPRLRGSSKSAGGFAGRPARPAGHLAGAIAGRDELGRTPATCSMGSACAGRRAHREAARRQHASLPLCVRACTLSRRRSLPCRRLPGRGCPAGGLGGLRLPRRPGLARAEHQPRTRCADRRDSSRRPGKILIVEASKCTSPALPGDLFLLEHASQRPSGTGAHLLEACSAGTFHFLGAPSVLSFFARTSAD